MGKGCLTFSPPSGPGFRLDCKISGISFIRLFYNGFIFRHLVTDFPPSACNFFFPCEFYELPRSEYRVSALFSAAPTCDLGALSNLPYLRSRSFQGTRLASPILSLVGGGGICLPKAQAILFFFSCLRTARITGLGSVRLSLRQIEHLTLQS